MARSFTDIIADLSGGATFHELTDQLADLTRAVAETRRSGTLTLKLKLEPNGDLGIKITDEVAIKRPQPSRGTSLFFTTPDGDLLRRDPRQSDMFPKAVEPKKETQSQ